MVRTIPKRKIARVLARQNDVTFQVGDWVHFDKECEDCCAVEIKPNSKVEIIEDSTFYSTPVRYAVKYTAENVGIHGTRGWVCAHHLTKVKRKKG